MEQANFNFDIQAFEEEVTMDTICEEEKDWGVLVDGILVPKMTEQDANDLAERLRQEGKNAIAAKVTSPAQFSSRK